MLSLIWLSTKKEEQAEEAETVINFSLGRDEDCRPARPGVRQSREGWEERWRRKGEE